MANFLVVRECYQEIKEAEDWWDLYLNGNDIISVVKINEDDINIEEK